MVFITKSYQDLFGVRSYINAIFYVNASCRLEAIGKKCCKANRQPTSFFCFCRRHGKVTSYLSGCCQCIKPYL